MATLFDVFTVSDELTEQQVQAVELLAIADRGGLTLEQVAEKIGVTVRTLHRWRKMPPFQEAVVNRALMNVRADLPAVFEANLKGAKKGNTKHIELLYKLLGMLIDKQEVKQTVEDKRDNASIQKDIDKLTRLLDGEDKEEPARLC